MISSTYKIDILISSVIPAHCTCPHIICHSGTLKLHVLFFSYSGSFQRSFCLRCPSLLSQYLLPNLSYFLKTDIIVCNWSVIVCNRSDVIASSKASRNIKNSTNISVSVVCPQSMHWHELLILNTITFCSICYLD